jgi:hypothetical protein
MDLYMKMLTITAEHKISMTDLCLYLIMNSTIPNGNFNFRKGGGVDEKNVAEIRRLNGELTRMQREFSKLREANMKLEYEEEQILKKLATAERINEDNYQEIRNENKSLKEQMKHWQTYGYPKSQIQNSDKEKK